MKNTILLIFTLIVFNVNSLSAQEESHFGHIKLVASTGGLGFSTDFYFNSNATLGLDPNYDSSSANGNPLTLFSQLVDPIYQGDNYENYKFKIQSVGPEDMNDVTIPLFVKASDNDVVSIGITETDLPNNIEVSIIDTLTQTTTLINNNNFTFIANNTVGVGRFYIKFNSATLSTPNEKFDYLKIYSINNQIFVKGKLISKTEINVYDINAKKVMSKNLDIASDNQIINAIELSTGIYVVELKTETNNRLSKKIIIKN